MQLQLNWREKLEKMQGMWQERLNCFYSDNKYVSDLQQFNFYVNKGTRESELHVGEKLQKPPEQSFNIRNAFQQLWDDDKVIEFCGLDVHSFTESIIFEGQPVELYRNDASSGFKQKRPSSVRHEQKAGTHHQLMHSTGINDSALIGGSVVSTGKENPHDKSLKTEDQI